MSRKRIDTSVIHNEERTPESQNSPNSPKTVLTISNIQEIKQMGLIKFKERNKRHFYKSFYISINGKSKTKPDN